MSLYEGVPEEGWAEVTRKLIDAHPLDPDEIVEVVLLCWQDIFESKIGRRGLRIGTDVFPTPQIMATLLHELVPAEFQHRYPDKWRRDASGTDKDLVYIPDERYSAEIKCSSSAKSIYANRSYAQQHTENKKARAGYFIGVNFQKFSDDLRQQPAITRVSFGWLDWTDWIPQASPTGQQAYLSTAAKRFKMLELWSNKRQLEIGGE
jgi:ScaI restriction endonuclease